MVNIGMLYNLDLSTCTEDLNNLNFKDGNWHHIVKGRIDNPITDHHYYYIDGVFCLGDSAATGSDFLLINSELTFGKDHGEDSPYKGLLILPDK